ncbi:MAG TPA: beta-ketoacyl-ACP synthase II [Armatimonadota bacterium]|jgi:3-oxoacyl-[acyl-carrier-protein] synthase II|nr:beta-ketoacyl-ACP synthase II [Armatimonadota bacterium]HOM81821.1 beta-ketoacyl-ACP synthase II [Armatimonadota bacterium]HPO72635.1 beta-ketoacyl-ACP synthase II [Armatimonadota bacterium]HPT98105.1 beta-ketoacyl-ACP synthase II [Armatimonadota bacterium]
MSKRRVVITGVGPVAPNGTGKEAFWEALMTGRSGIRQITRFDASAYACRVAGLVEDLNLDEFIEPRRSRHMGRFAQLAVVGALLAMRDAGLNEQDATEAARRGVCLGVSQNAVDILERGFEQFLKGGARKASPALTGNAFPHAAAAEISIACRCEGPTSTISAGCASGTAAIGAAREEIRSGRADVMLSGGADGAVTPYVLAAMCATRVLPSQKDGEDPGEISRPFDATRRGGVLAEGAGVLVLEELNHALRRGARIYGEIVGYGSNAEAHGMVGFADNDTFLERSMRLALADGRLRPNEVDYICAHGPSDGCDTQETRAIKAVFGAHAYSLAVSSIKSMIGNPLASAGPLQVITAALALEHQKVPPTTNYQVPDPECDLDYVPNQPRVCRVNVALVNSHGFGGANHSLVVARYRDYRRG